MQQVMEMPKKVVRKIPAKIDIAEEIKQAHRQLRVAAYCRVSTAQEEQLNSYDVQVRYYTEKIRSEPKWAFVGIFADRGLSGTSTKKRDEFNKMIKMCRHGKIDMIITKSISRFARNTADVLKYVRMLKDVGVDIFFEEQNIHSKQSLSQYENGSIPDIQRVMAIARALDFPAEYFLQEDKCKTITEVTYFRSLTSATRMSRKAHSLKLECVAKVFQILEQYVEFPILNLPKVEFVGNDNEFDDVAQEAMQEEIESIALVMREHWGLGLLPISNLQLTLEENGIVVTGFDIVDKKIDAFSQRTLIDGGDVFFIAVVQGEKPKGRIFFDMAHELGHILLHPWSESLDLISKEDFKSRENQANRFASAFLLPKESFLREIQAYPTDLNYYLHLKKRWHCSMQAMIYRAHQLNAITDNQYQYMMRQVSKKGWRTNEPGDTPYYLNENIFQGAIDVLFEADYLNPSTLLQLFKKYGVTMYPEDIEELLHLRKDTLKVEPSPPRIVQLKRPDQQDGGN